MFGVRSDRRRFSVHSPFMEMSMARDIVRPLKLFYLVPTLLLLIFSFLLAFFVSFYVLFHTCCSHSQVFGKTLVHEFTFSKAILNSTLFSFSRGRIFFYFVSAINLNTAIIIIVSSVPGLLIRCAVHHVRSDRPERPLQQRMHRTQHSGPDASKPPTG